MMRRLRTTRFYSFADTVEGRFIGVTVFGHLGEELKFSFDNADMVDICGCIVVS